ncbi:MAG: hypothetical protein K2Y56_16630 [Methylobacterium sp.]|uniref:hypothetical protein n=1 Tax=Methylobacterium sp. TaxID=409 RepID=UPI0025F8336F|nr:hypothetical protein [Methylobacterium sp.]MBX9933137.1 hypothetical protein [Methylobacterium sp.]
MLVFYLILGLFDPASPVNAIFSFRLFLVFVLGALVLSRRTMNIIQQHSFLPNQRSTLQTGHWPRRIGGLGFSQISTRLRVPPWRAYE